MLIRVNKIIDVKEMVSFLMSLYETMVKEIDLVPLENLRVSLEKEDYDTSLEEIDKEREYLTKMDLQLDNLYKTILEYRKLKLNEQIQQSEEQTKSSDV